MLTNPTGFFSDDYISAPRGRWPLKFLHALDTGQSLLAHTTNWVRGPPKNFKGKYLKLSLKFHICAPITLGVVDVTSRNFYQVMWLLAGVITCTVILQGVPPTKFGRVKNVQNSARFVITFDFDRKYLRNGSTYLKS